jgi:AdoMet-dependent rRNA methyltransferase SPB1
MSKTMTTKKLKRQLSTVASSLIWIVMTYLTVLSLGHSLVTPEAVTLALQLVNGERTKTELINDGFNRYSLNSKEGLPSWFLDDEAKSYKPNIPITKEAVAALRAKQMALNARPIKKVAEAKARKKHKAAKSLQKALKKAEGIDASDMTEREKAQQIGKLMRRGTAKKQERKKAQVVVAKGINKGTKGRPKGVKGRYVMVDARMKKEVRFVSCLHDPF